MDWMDEVRVRLQRKNQVLFTKDSTYLQDLAGIFHGLDHRAAVLWAFDFAAESIDCLEKKYPHEQRPRDALEAARAWAAGAVKMPLAQRKILDCHAFAKEIICKADIAVCHAVGQACAVVHTAGHVMGYPIYDLTAIVYRLGIENCEDQVEQRKQTYIDRLLYWENHWQDFPGPWAGFMCR
ncbi:MAG: putative immunity protein [Clostridia bacterium]